jgi:outer membrane immunogenic protein
MKSNWLGAAVIGLIGPLTIATAFAADLPPAPAYKASAYVAPPSWTGFYIGANGGYGWNGVGASEAPADPATLSPQGGGHLGVDPSASSFNKSGWLAGIQAGYNWQFNPSWLVGVEADFDGADIRGSGSSPVDIANSSPTIAALNASQQVNWFGTVRARLGYLPTSNLLLYATGGLAYGGVHESANVGFTATNVGSGIGIGGFSFACSSPGLTGPGGWPGPTCFAGSQSRTSAGWAAGGGAEYQFSSNATLKLEYLYVNLGSNSFNLTAQGTLGGTPSFLKASFGDAAFNLVRLGVNYHF